METTDETTSTNLFLANHGYDVFTMDFRTAYVPNFAYDQFGAYGLAAELAATADWTYGVFREDIKACVDKLKCITRANKVFLGGRSRGGTQMYIYASKYWQEDLKRLIGLDGGGVHANIPNPGAQMTEEQYLAAVQAFKMGLLPPASPYSAELHLAPEYASHFFISTRLMTVNRSGKKQCVWSGMPVAATNHWKLSSGDSSGRLIQ